MPEVVQTYDYVDEGGTLLFVVERLKPKGFRQKRPDGEGWAYNLQGVRRVPYRLPEVVAEAAKGAAGRVVVVEGEKDADSLAGIGKVATTAPGGAGKWLPEFSPFLRGVSVAVVADADDPGRRHALEVASSLDGEAASVVVLEPAEGCKDVSDHLAKGRRLSELRRLDRAAVQASLVPQRARERAGVVSAKVFCARPGLNGSARVLGPLLWRGQRTTLGAATGDGKSTMGCQMVRAVVYGEEFLGWRGAGGAKGLVVDVEQGEETLKQRMRDLGLDSVDEVDLLHEPDGLALDSDEDDRRYVEGILRDGGYAVALFDPLYQLHHGDQNSERTAADVMRILDDWSRRFEVAIVVPMHRRKPHPQAGKNSFTMNEIGGNGAWVRNSEIVLGLQLVYPGMSRLHFFKDRPGYLPGVGTSWPLSFDKDECRFERAEDGSPHGKSATKEALRNAGVATADELASQFDLQPSTILGHLRQVHAHPNPDDRTLPDTQRRWSLEAWPERQPSLEGLEA